MVDIARLKANALDSIGSNFSSLSIADLPNLPGVRRDNSSRASKLFKDYKASRPNTGNINEDFPQSIEEEKSLVSYFEGLSKIQEYSKTLSPFPSQGGAYNDLTGRYSLISQKNDRVNKSRTLPYTNTEALPTFVTNTSNIFTFLACFTENNNENQGQTRKVEIKVYLEDNSIEIVEPRVENSGTWHGKFLKRHQIYKPVSSNNVNTENTDIGSLLYTVADFYSGAELTFYNRVYKILDCDLITRKYFDDIGLSFGYPLSLPSTVYDPSMRASMSRAAKRNSKLDATQSKHQGFFEYDRKVLRFYGVWDQTDMLFGDELRVRVHYSLADDKIEVIPVHNRNSGRDKLSKLLKKTKIIKPFPTIQQQQQQLQQTNNEAFLNNFRVDSTNTYDSQALRGFTPMNNTLNGINSLSRQGDGSVSVASNNNNNNAMNRTNTAGLRPVTRSTYSSEVSIISNMEPEVFTPSKAYHWSDLQIGELISVAALNILLIDADEFTREFYSSKNMGLLAPINIPERVYPRLDIAIPPYNGFGSEDDSLQTCKPKLIPGRAMKDGAKAKLFQGMVLRYKASLFEPSDTNINREFIIEVHLEDDTVQIREPLVNNSGHKGGTFLSRCKLENHHSNTKAFENSDLYTGAIVTILSHKFLIEDADAYTLKYMESNVKIYPYSDIQKILKKLKHKKEVLQRVILTYPSLNTCFIQVEELEKLIERVGLEFEKQEIITLFRTIDTFRAGIIKLTKLLKFIMDL